MDINAGQLIFAGAFLLLGIFIGAMITYAKFVLYRKKAQETEEEKKKHELYAQEMKDLS
ncbi:MAG: hypothetical protein HUJ98_15115, partial [Bacteroidaceae bacterium]|nr:hypothetical protein [Bacteroidaceae bacterium]